MTMILTLVISFQVPKYLEKLGGTESQSAWSTLSAVFGILGGILLVINFLTIKEKVPLSKDSTGHVKKIPLKDSAKAVIANKYFFLAVIMSVSVLAASGLAAANSYFVIGAHGDSLRLLFGCYTFPATLDMLLSGSMRDVAGLESISEKKKDAPVMEDYYPGSMNVRIGPSSEDAALTGSFRITDTAKIDPKTRGFFAKIFNRNTRAADRAPEPAEPRHDLKKAFCF